MFEAEVAAPFEDAAFMVEQIRNLSFPVIVARFEDMSRAEAISRANEINHELRSHHLPELGPIKYRRGAAS